MPVAGPELARRGNVKPGPVISGSSSYSKFRHLNPPDIHTRHGKFLVKSRNSEPKSISILAGYHSRRRY
jgi:hypothetical protein